MEARWVWRDVRPQCRDQTRVVMSRLDRGFTCRKGEGGVHRPGGQPLGVRRGRMGCREGDELCEEFRTKCFFMVNGCGVKSGGMRNYFLKSLESKKNNRIVINDITSYMKERQRRQGLD